MEENNTLHKARGGCFCGKVNFYIDLPVNTVFVCHCSMCRRANGSDYSTWVVVTKDKFYIKGLGDIKYFQNGEHSANYFCTTCGTTVFTEDSRRVNIYGIPAGVIHHDIELTVSKQLFYDDKAHWLKSVEMAPKYGGDSGFEPI